jgi:DMSO reductase anchor subunit
MTELALFAAALAAAAFHDMREMKREGARREAFVYLLLCAAALLAGALYFPSPRRLRAAEAMLALMGIGR